jgi:hypothetical protein
MNSFPIEMPLKLTAKIYMSKGLKAAFGSAEGRRWQDRRPGAENDQ